MPWLALKLHVERAAAEAFSDALLEAGAQSVALEEQGGMVVLQLRLKERFGWWPVDRAQLDRNGRARFSVKPPGRVRARVVLTLADGATPLAISAPLRLGRG